MTARPLGSISEPMSYPIAPRAANDGFRQGRRLCLPDESCCSENKQTVAHACDF
jgi:hypothetical protein